MNFCFAGMAKLVDALDLGSSGETHKSSSLFTRTNFLFLPLPRPSHFRPRRSDNGGNDTKKHLIFGNL